MTHTTTWSRTDSLTIADACIDHGVMLSQDQCKGTAKFCIFKGVGPWPHRTLYSFNGSLKWILAAPSRRPSTWVPFIASRHMCKLIIGHLVLAFGLAFYMTFSETDLPVGSLSVVLLEKVDKVLRGLCNYLHRTHPLKFLMCHSDINNIVHTILHGIGSPDFSIIHLSKKDHQWRFCSLYIMVSPICHT